MSDFCQKKFKAYHEKTFSIDPSSFLEPLAKRVPPEASILDVGCGSGRDLCWLKQRGFRVMGFERSKDLAALARKYAECQIMEGDFEIYDFSKLNVDAIIFVGALVHVPHEKLKPIFKHITSGLTENGKVLVTLKQGEGTFTDDHGKTYYLWQDSDLQTIFSEVGFTVLDFKRQISMVRANDIWLGYVLDKTIDI